MDLRSRREYGPRPSWLRAQHVLRGSYEDSGLAFRELLHLQFVRSALAPTSNQSALSSSVSSTLRHVLTCNSKTVGWAGTFDSKNGNKNVIDFDWHAYLTNAQ